MKKINLFLIINFIILFFISLSYSQSLQQQAYSYYLLGNYQKAAEILEHILEDNDSPKIRRTLATVYNNWAQQYQISNPEKAKELYEKAIDYSANQPVIRYNYANLLFKMGNYEEAIYQLDCNYNRLSNTSEKEKFDFLLGQAYLKLNDYDKAQYYFEELPEEKYPQSLFYLGYISYQQGDLKTAREIWRKFQKNYPSQATRFQIEKWLQKSKREEKVEGTYYANSSSHFLVFAEYNAKNVDVNSLLTLLENAYWDIGRYFDFYPQNRVTIVLYTSHKVYQLATSSPAWTSGLWDGSKIRLPAELLKTNKNTFAITIYHEYTHLVIAEKYRDRTLIPLWLNEGCAQYLSYYLTNNSYPNLKFPLQAYSYLSYLDNPQYFRNAKTASFAYYFSYKAVEWITSDFGKDTLLLFLKKWAQRKNPQQIYEETFGFNKQEFWEKLKEYLLEKGKKQ